MEGHKVRLARLRGTPGLKVLLSLGWALWLLASCACKLRSLHS